MGLEKLHYILDKHGCVIILYECRDVGNKVYVQFVAGVRDRGLMPCSVVNVSC